MRETRHYPMLETDSEYNTRRLADERAAAARSGDPMVRAIHDTLASYHAACLDGYDLLTLAHDQGEHA